MEFLGQHRTGPGHCFFVPQLAAEKFFGPRSPCRRGRHTTESQTGFGHDIAAVGLDLEGGGHRADVHLAALGNFEPLASSRNASRRSARIDRHLKQDFIRLERRLAVAGEKIRHRDRALSARRSQHDIRAQGEQDRRGVADRRSRHQIPPQRGAVADLARAEDPEHLGPHGKIFRDGLAQLRQGHRSADPPAVFLFLEAP